MCNERCSLNGNINNIRNQFGTQNELVVRTFVIGENSRLEASIIYINGLVNKDMIDRDILNPNIRQSDFRGGENE